MLDYVTTPALFRLQVAYRNGISDLQSGLHHFMKAFQDYSFQTFPNLSSARLPGNDRYHFTLPFELGNGNNDVEQLRLFSRVAFAHVVLQYVESRDFLFAEVSSDDVAAPQSFQLSQLKPVRLRIDAPAKDHPEESEHEEMSVAWDDLVTELQDALTNNQVVTIEETKRLLGLGDHSELFPFPAVFLWDWNTVGNVPKDSEGVDGTAIVPSRYDSLMDEATLIMGMSHPANGHHTHFLHASSSGTLMSSAMVSTFLRQVHLVLTRILVDSTAMCNLSLQYTPTDVSHHTSSSIPSGSEPSLSALFSEYTSREYSAQLESAIAPLNWLAMISHSHPTRIAHEIYGPHAFSTPPVSSTSSATLGNEGNAMKNEVVEVDLRPFVPTATLTYGRLDSLSDTLARWLLRPFTDYSQTRNKGVASNPRIYDGQGGGGLKRGVTICVCLERTANFYIAQAAIWKAGGIYVPVCPA